MQIDRRGVLKAVAAAATGAAVGGVAIGTAERRHVAVTHTTLDVTRLPSGFTGFRIAYLSDLHRSAFVPADIIEHAVALTMAERPDLIVLGGDYITEMDRRFVEPAADALTSLNAPAGVLAVMGNHDDERLMPAALTRRGIKVLREARTRLMLNHDALDFIGIDYWTKKPALFAHLVDPAVPTVLLAHDPRRLVEAVDLKISLVLSGHTHGGQVVVPGLGPINQFRFPTVAGTKRESDTLLFVSRGIGTIYVPIRINCPPEVAILTLARREQGAL